MPVDIRGDYVRSLSSASFILVVRFESNEGRHESMHLAVSGESCFSVDGKMQADVIYLYPEQGMDDILVGSSSIYSATDLDDLCDMLFAAATIKGWMDPMAAYNQYQAKVNGLTFAIDGKLKFYSSHAELSERIEKLGGKVSPSVSSEIHYLICNKKESASRKASKARELGIPILSDMEFAFGLFGHKPGKVEEDCTDEGVTVSVRDVAPITIGNFRNACAKAGITLANLTKIIIQNNKFGNRDSAMFIFCNNDKFFTYKNMYRHAPEEQKQKIAEDFISFVKTEPVLDIIDNEYELPGTMCCVWIGSEEMLEKEMLAYLEGNDPGHWMGTYSMEFTIDVARRIVTSRKVLFFGDV